MPKEKTRNINISKNVDLDLGFDNWEYESLRKLEIEINNKKSEEVVKKFCKIFKEKYKLIMNFYIKCNFSKDYAQICVHQEFLKQLHASLNKKNILNNNSKNLKLPAADIFEKQNELEKLIKKEKRRKYMREYYKKNKKRIRELQKTYLKTKKEWENKKSTLYSENFTNMNDFLQVVLTKIKPVDILQEAINIAEINSDSIDWNSTQSSTIEYTPPTSNI